MNNPIYRIYDTVEKKHDEYIYLGQKGTLYDVYGDVIHDDENRYIVERSTGLYDKNKVLIFQNDILQFSNKYEWYRNDTFKLRLEGKTKEEIDEYISKASYERRIINPPEVWEWLHSGEIQIYREIIGHAIRDEHLLSDK